MKTSRTLLWAIVATTIISCSENKQNTTTEIIEEQETTIVQDTISMPSYTNTGEIEVNGDKYNYAYNFAPSKSLPVVTNSSDQKYHDNRIELTITKGGEAVHTITFTKSTFKQFIPEELYSTIVLMGFNFNYNKENEHDKFYFVASVGDPDDEEYYIPIDISIATNGEVSFNKFVDINSNNKNTEDGV